jgi:hypothetical protein
MKNENEEVINMINHKKMCIYIGVETEDNVFSMSTPRPFDARYVIFSIRYQK